MEEFLTSLSIFLWSMVKYAFGLGIALYSNLGFLESLFLNVLGGMAGIVVFMFFGKIIQNGWDELFPGNGKPKPVMNRKNRMLVRIRKSFGLAGVAILTPVLLSVPLGTVLALSLTTNRRKIFVAISLSMVFWSLAFFVPFYSLGIDIQDLVKNLLSAR